MKLFCILSTVLLLGTEAQSGSFNEKWLARIKPAPYGGIATRFDDRTGAWGNRIDRRERICAHMLEVRGQILRVTNIANGKSVDCRVEDRGPHRRFWPRREVDLTPLADADIGCNGYCTVTIDRIEPE